MSADVKEERLGQSGVLCGLSEAIFCPAKNILVEQEQMILDHRTAWRCDSAPEAS
jgi:hypothetical protein